MNDIIRVENQIKKPISFFMYSILHHSPTKNASSPVLQRIQLKNPAQVLCLQRKMCLHMCVYVYGCVYTTQVPSLTVIFILIFDHQLISCS